MNRLRHPMVGNSFTICGTADDVAYIEDKVERGRKIRRSLIERKQA